MRGVYLTAKNRRLWRRFFIWWRMHASASTCCGAGLLALAACALVAFWFATAGTESGLAVQSQTDVIREYVQRESLSLLGPSPCTELTPPLGIVAGGGSVRVIWETLSCAGVEHFLYWRRHDAAAGAASGVVSGVAMQMGNPFRIEEAETVWITPEQAVHSVTLLGAEEAGLHPHDGEGKDAGLGLSMLSFHTGRTDEGGAAAALVAAAAAGESGADGNGNGASSSVRSKIESYLAKLRVRAGGGGGGGGVGAADEPSIAPSLLTGKTPSLLMIPPSMARHEAGGAVGRSFSPVVAATVITADAAAAAAATATGIRGHGGEKGDVASRASAGATPTTKTTDTGQATASSASSSSTAASPESPVTIAVIGDSQSAATLFRRHLSHIAARSPSLVVHLGDSVQDAFNVREVRKKGGLLECCMVLQGVAVSVSHVSYSLTHSLTRSMPVLLSSLRSIAQWHAYLFGPLADTWARSSSIPAPIMLSVWAAHWARSQRSNGYPDDIFNR